MGTIIGVAMLMALLGVAVNVAVGLWARTRVESVAYDAARSVATAPDASDPLVVRRRAIDRACDLLGPRCDDVTLSFVSPPGAPVVVLHVQSEPVGLLPRMLSSTGSVVGGLDRRIHIRSEAA